MNKSIIEYFPSAKQKTATEYCAPCPLCGGNDRFIVWPNRDRGGAYLCRGCGIQGDGIQYLRNYQGMTYPEACEALGLTTNSKGSFTPARQSVHPPKVQSVTIEPPCEQWRTKAAHFLKECQAELYSTAAVQALQGRFLTHDTALTSGIGWNPQDRYENREAWGLPHIEGKDKMVIPFGVVICTRRRSGPMGLTIRTVDATRPKYWQISGGVNVPFLQGRSGLPVVLLESALDAALIWQEAGDICTAIATMGSSKPIDVETATFVNNAPLVLACPDYDVGGKTAWQRWKAQFPQALIVPPVGAKDLGEMHAAALTPDESLSLNMKTPTICQWTKAALNYTQPHNNQPPNIGKRNK